MEVSIKDIIFWLCLAVIFVWIILKAAGIIHSPAWIEVIPYASAIFGAGIAFQILRELRNDLKETRFNLKEINIELKEIDKRLIRVETSLAH